MKRETSALSGRDMKEEIGFALSKRPTSNIQHRTSNEELRESKQAFRLVKGVSLMEDPVDVNPLLRRTVEMVKIFAVSIRSAEKNRVREESAEGYDIDPHPSFGVRC